MHRYLAGIGLALLVVGVVAIFLKDNSYLAATCLVLGVGVTIFAAVEDRIEEFSLTPTGVRAKLGVKRLIESGQAADKELEEGTVVPGDEVIGKRP